MKKNAKKQERETLLQAMSVLCKEKGIEEDVIFDAIEAAMLAGYKKNYAQSQNVQVRLDRTTGIIKVFTQKEVVEDDAVFDPQIEISILDAKKLNPALELGDFVDVEVTPDDFGRITAMTAKQVVTQRIREAEREIIYREYNEKINDIITGSIQKIDKGNVFIDIGKTEAILPVGEQPQNERDTYYIHQSIRCFVSEVKNGTKGTQIILSRTHPGLVRCLFQREVPEIEQGIVEIKNIAREAGSRTKIAVYSADPNVDPQGACIGPKGMRVQNIGDELKDEKIDIVKYSDDPVAYIAESLSPAKVLRTVIDEENHSAQVVVPAAQLSLAIGKSGQNVRLAAKLTGWKIDIVTSESELKPLKKPEYEEELFDEEIDFDEGFPEYEDEGRAEPSIYDEVDGDSEFIDDFDDEEELSYEDE
ncbi:MAG: transcription termination/antitermination protein NusA [Clostridia bacterium]|nr:transcription termination/antitermination protein NusA [Clostridia bacterium]